MVEITALSTGFLFVICMSFPSRSSVFEEFKQRVTTSCSGMERVFGKGRVLEEEKSCRRKVVFLRPAHLLVQIYNLSPDGPLVLLSLPHSLVCVISFQPPWTFWES